MEIEKKNTIFIIILCVLVLGLGGYIIFDKILSKQSLNEINVNNCINEKNQNIIEKNYEQSYEYLVNNLNCSFYDAISFCSDSFYIKAKCENDIIKEIYYADVIHERTEDSTGIGISIITNKGEYTNYNDNEDMDMYYRILKSAGIKEMELINGMKYAYEISERNNNVEHDPYCD